jgi:3-deoxy-manno-octulosonate cytidylyltransferase (CMP-KDO synthetase)
MSIIAVIPARMASSRYPGKPLKKILGLSMIEHVRRRVSLCEIIDQVYVATCDEEILVEVEKYGGKAVMTSSSHESCVDRVNEVALGLDAEIIINVQGDMPLVDPDSLKDLVSPLVHDEKVLYSDMITPIHDTTEINSSNVVKVVKNTTDDALYYSREAIPSSSKAVNSNYTYYKQLGVNAFRKKTLKLFTELKRTPLEIIESIDMLRLLENNLPIRLVQSTFKTVGVDTRDDLALAIELMREDNIFPIYKDTK